MSRKMRRMDAEALSVRLAFPDSCFTKRGPGIEDSRRKAFWSLPDWRSRALAVRRGWVPPSFGKEIGL